MCNSDFERIEAFESLIDDCRLTLCELGVVKERVESLIVQITDTQAQTQDFQKRFVNTKQLGASLLLHQHLELRMLAIANNKEFFQNRLQQLQGGSE